MTIGVYLFKPQRDIQPLGRFHGFNGIKAHPFIAFAAGFLDYCLCQCSADTMSLIMRQHKKSFHFTDAIPQGTQCNAAGIAIVNFSQKNAARRQFIITRQSGQFTAFSPISPVQSAERISLMNRDAATLC